MVKKPTAEPLCTRKELLVFGVFCVVYSAIIFSLDPEWVAWAAPLAFGGALYAQGPVPASVHFGSPAQAFQVAYLFDVINLLGIALLGVVGVVKGSARLGWLSGCKAVTEKGGFARVRSYLRSVFTLTPGR